MSDAYVIEIDDVAVGVVVRQGEADGGRRYCFYAANAPFRSIDGKSFRTPDKARKAAIALTRNIRKSARAETIVRHYSDSDPMGATSAQPFTATKSRGGAVKLFPNRPQEPSLPFSRKKRFLERLISSIRQALANTGTKHG